MREFVYETTPQGAKPVPFHEMYNLQRRGAQAVKLARQKPGTGARDARDGGEVSRGPMGQVAEAFATETANVVYQDPIATWPPVAVAVPFAF